MGGGGDGGGSVLAGMRVGVGVVQVLIWWERLQSGEVNW